MKWFRYILEGIVATIVFISPNLVGVFDANIIGLIFLSFAIFLPIYIYVRSSKQNKVFQNVLTILISESVSITLIDIVSRYILDDIFKTRPHDRYFRRSSQYPDLFRYDSNVNFEGEIVGDLVQLSGVPKHSELRTVKFMTDEYGFRNNLLSDEQIDIITLGDSFGVGSGTHQDDIWSNVLAKSTNLTTYNFSMPGSPFDQLNNLNLEIERINLNNKPILVWMLFSGNDLDDRYYESDFEENNLWESMISNYTTFRHRSPIRKYLKQLFNRTMVDPVRIGKLPDEEIVIFHPTYVERSYLTLDDIRQHPNLPKIEATIATMSELAKEYDIIPIIVVAPSKAEVYSWLLDGAGSWSTVAQPSPFALVIEEIAEAEDMCFIDLTSPMIEQSEVIYKETNRILWWRDDTHWNDIGHHFVAMQIASSPCFANV